MNNSKTIKLPFWETVGRSFSFTFSNLNTIFKISISWLLILALGLLAGYYYCTSGFNAEAGVNVQRLSVFLVAFSILLSLVMLIIQVAFVRRTVLRQDFVPFYLSFGPKEWKYIFYTLLIVAVILAPVIVATELLSFVNLGIYASYILLVVFLLSAIIGSKFMLVLPAVAVENKNLGIFKSWDMTKGNANRIFWGMILLAIPGYVCFVLLGSINMALGPISETIVMKLVFLTLVFIVSFIDVSLKASFYGHIYQYFVYFSKPKAQAVVVKEEIIVIKETPAAKAPTPAKKPAAKKAAVKKAEPKPAAKKAPAAKAPAKKAAPAKAKKTAAPKKPAAKKK